MGQRTIIKAFPLVYDYEQEILLQENNFSHGESKICDLLWQQLLHHLLSQLPCVFLYILSWSFQIPQWVSHQAPENESIKNIDQEV